MLNVKQSKTFVVEHNIAPQISTFSLPPFRSTYWTENKKSSSVMAWLPYFSQCGFRKRFMMLNDLILGGNCQSNVFEEVICHNQEYLFDCVIEEYLVGTINSEYWFNAVNSKVCLS